MWDLLISEAGSDLAFDIAVGEYVLSVSQGATLFGNSTQFG
jgi:hypothetical protein